jgi:hypothetical protein
MIYSDTQLSHNKKRRVFNESVNSEELKWHKDEYDRIIFVESSDGWKLQMDEELPQDLKVGQKYSINKETYHRVIKGSGDLKIVIIEDNDFIRVPSPVISQMKKGLIYSKKNGKINRFIEKVIENNVIHKSELSNFKNFYDNTKDVVTLNESFKGKPEKDEKYVEWLLNGGDVGYQWVISKSL